LIVERGWIYFQRHGLGECPRLALAVEKIKAAYKEELEKRAGKQKGAAVEAVARRFNTSKRTVYRVLAAPS
jgi:hypothetical protein